MRRKYAFPDRAAAEQAQRRSSELENLTNIALSEVLAGNLTWLERGNYPIGLIRPESANGGIAVVVWHCEGQRDTVRVWLVDDLYRECGPEWASRLTDQDSYDLGALAACVIVERDQRAGYRERV